jgi:HlyD family secretion protein
MTSRARAIASLAALAPMGAIGILLNGSPGDSAVTATARRGTLTVTLTEAGTLRAAASITYRSPLEGREVEITYLAPEGTHVREGDLLVRLDTTALQAEHERAIQVVRQVEMELEAAQIDRQEAALAVQSVTEGAGALSLDEGRMSLRLAEARANRLREDHDRLQPLLAKGYITREELDRSRLELDEADARAQLAARALQVLTERTHPAEEKTARLQLARRQAQLAHLAPKLAQARGYADGLAVSIARCSIAAPRPGLVVYEDNLSTMPRRKVRVGDRVTPSQGLISLPDLRRMVVEASVREGDVHLLKGGQRAAVRAEAFPNVMLRGVVARLGVLAQAREGAGAGDSRFDLVIELDPAPVDLRPGMKARVEVVADERRDVVLVPLNGLFTHGGRTVCYLRRGDAVERRSVETGRANETEVEIVGGLEPGDRVLLVEPDPGVR